MSVTEIDACMELLDIVIDTTHARAELDSLRAERDALRALVAELEQARQFQQGMIDGLNVAINIKDDEIDTLREQIDDPGNEREKEYYLRGRRS